MLPNDLQYSAQHAWVRLEGATASVGVTEDVAAALGPLTKIKLPAVGSSIRCGDRVAVLHGAATHEVVAPISGTITDANMALVDNPASLATDPFGEGWLFKIKVEAGEEIEKLRDVTRFQRESADGAEEPDSP